MWTREPNVWVRDAVAHLTPGRALDVAAGDGRHALWLASLGWSVTALDISLEGVRQGAALARAQQRDQRQGARRAGEVAWVVADARTPAVAPGSADLVLVAYLHLPADDLAEALGRAGDAVAPGGRAVVVGHDVRNPAEGTGGPQDVAVLTSPSLVAGVLTDHGLQVERAEVAARPVPDAARPALDTVVVAVRPAGPRSRTE
ncbi:class I SAM-dependent methyltransferase [Actinotalea fermentans]|uniref:class I SAM-dependent methyltransferase n=1 Tax=Actinotalea fermentans TaxID=43671 RepID=UPI001C998F2B|nr:class I SAM-dependent methyltransferase [Actinotalea fermentans]